MIEPKDGEWWVCTCEGYEQVLMLKGGIWVTTSCGKVGAYSTSIITPLYKMVKAVEPKSRTKVVYEKVSFKKVTDIFAILESGEWLYTSNNGDSHIDLYLAMSREPCTMIDREFYRKVEKEIDWKDELSFFSGA